MVGGEHRRGASNPPTINHYSVDGNFVSHSLCFNRVRSINDNRSGFSGISIEGIHSPLISNHFLYGHHFLGASWSTPRIWRCPRLFGFPNNKRGSHTPLPYRFFAAVNSGGSVVCVFAIYIMIPKYAHCVYTKGRAIANKS